MKFHLRMFFTGALILALVIPALAAGTSPSKSKAAEINQVEIHQVDMEKRTRTDLIRFFKIQTPKTTTTIASTTTTSTTLSHITRTRSVQPVRVQTSPVSSDFWKLLSNCESSTGLGGNGGGYFQFSPDTAAKVGYRPGQSYATQLAEAQWWAARIHPNEGSTSGWPHCWWVALRG